MSHLSRVSALGRARASIQSDSLRFFSPLTRTIRCRIPDHGPLSGSRGYAKASAFAGFGDRFRAVNLTGTRSMSDSVPQAPTSNHPHTPVPGATGQLVYTETDEAPALATFSLLPVLSKVSVYRREMQRLLSVVTGT